MRKLILYHLCGALLACTALSGCAANGKFASKANGPVDPTVTFNHSCNGAKILDGVFQAAVVASGGKISAADVEIERDAFTAVTAICSGPVPADLNGALLAITADAAPIGALVSKYNAK